MQLRHFAIGQRTFVGFAFALVMLLVLGLFSLTQMSKIAANSVEIAENWLPATRMLGQFQAEVNYLRSQEVFHVAAENEDEMQRAEENIVQAKQKIAKFLADYDATIADEEDRRLFQELTGAWNAYLSVHENLMSVSDQGMRDEAKALLTSASRDRLGAIRTAFEQIAEYNQKGGRAARDLGQTQYADAKVLVWSVILAAVALTLAGSILLTRSITKPLADAVQAANRIADNDLTQPLKVQGKDEISMLQSALQGMQNNLRNTLQQVAGAAAQLASAAEELNAVTEDSTQALTAQNNEIRMAATAVNEMSAAVEEVARHANETSDASRKAESSSGQGRAQVSKTKASIVQLTGAVNETSQNIQALAHQIGEINKVVEVIGAIADQTNLLALNAAIEAARAGEQGRGFSVVADEVRALAHRTQQSTREIAGMIEAIQSVTLKAVDAMSLSSSQADQSLALAEAADHALEEITDMVGRINEMNLSIASASEQQAQVAREVDQNLVNIRDIADQTAAGAQQTTASSQDLARLATDLNGMVTRFRL